MTSRTFKNHFNNLSTPHIYTLLNTAPIGIGLYKSTGERLFMNRYLCDLADIPQEKALTSDWQSLLHPEDKNRVQSEWREALDKKINFTSKFRYFNKKGETYWVSCSSSYLKNQSGAIDAFFVIVQNLTEQTLAKDSLRKNRLFLETIVDSLPLILFCKDSFDNFKYILWNKTASEMWGPHQEDVLGKTDYDFFSKEEADFFHQKDLETMKNDRIVTIDEEPLSTQKNGTIILKTIKVPIKDDTGKPRYLLGISEDITEMKKNQIIIEEQKHRILHAERMKSLGQMAGGIAHEINTPLAAISLYSSQIEDLIQDSGIQNNDIIEMNQKIQNTVTRIDKIIRGLRALARDGDDDPFEDCSLVKIIQDVMELCSAQFKEKDIVLEVQKIDPSIILKCRFVQIAQVLINLLNNARDAIIGKSGAFVRISAIQHQEHVDIRVTDSGTGIPKEIQAKILEPFFTTKAVGSGTGLGLSIAHSIIVSHKGSLFIDTEAPNTTFVVRLPNNTK